MHTGLPFTLRLKVLLSTSCFQLAGSLNGGSFALFLEHVSLNGRPAVACFDQIQGLLVNGNIVLRTAEVLVALTLSSGFSLAPIAL